MTNATRSITRQFKPSTRLALAALAVALLTLLPAGPTAQAQEADDDRDYVDVALTLEVPDDTAANVHRVDVIVVNNGTRTAYDVEIVVDVVSPDQSRLVAVHLRGDVIAPVGQISVDGTSVVWTIPELGPLQREVLTPLVQHEKPSGAGTFDNTSDPHEIFGTVTTASFESDRHKGNNTARVWSFQYSTNLNYWIQAAVDYSVDVSVDNRYPSPGETVNFTITAGRAPRHIGVARWPPPIDLKVDIELTGGLSHTGTPSYYSSDPDGDPFTPTTYSPIFQNDVFTIGTGTVTDEAGISDSVVLPVAVASDAVVNGQCLTARLTGNPPPGNGPLDDAVANNVAKLCLGEPPDRTVVFNSGEAGLLTWYNCVGRTTYPCSAADTVEIVALGGSAASDAGLPYEVFKPDKVVIQVQDPLGRATSSEENSSALVWSTGYDTEVVTRPGVVLSEELVSLDPSQWGVDVDEDDTRAATLNVEVSGPGKMATWAAGDSGDPYEWFGHATNGVLSESGTWYVDPGSYPWYAEFSKLGTYRVDFDGAISANNGTPVNTADDTSYTIAERTYVFHVGPIAEVGVSDGGPSPYVAAGSNALTIVAVNNGPDRAPGAQVTGLPTGADVIHVSHGSYNSTTGVWDIGELRPSSHYQSRGESEPTLALSAADGDTANVSIAISENYEVCIVSTRETLAHTTEAACEADTTNGGSWHEGTVYDYNADNNAATIMARAGTAGEPHPDASKNLSVIGDSIANILFWEPVAQVNGIPVTHYEIEYAEGGWQALKRDVEDRFYVDMTDSLSNRANRAYRVRAVNGFGYPGPWTVSSGGGRAVPPNAPRNFGAALVTDTDVELTWAAAEHGEALTHYIIQVSDHAGGPWSNLARPNGDADRWMHPNLPKTGATKHYRIRAHNRSANSAWVETSVALATPPDGAATPTGVRAQRYTTNQGNHGIQVWLGSYACDPGDADCWAIIEYRAAGGAWQFGSQEQSEYGIVPWGPDDPYFTQGDGRRHAVRLDTAYDIRVCQLSNDELEAKFKPETFAPEGEWCRGEPSGRVRVPAGE